MILRNISKKLSLFVHKSLWHGLVTAGFMVNVPSIAGAQSLQVGQSKLAILTDKEGLASALAHRHIIVASNWSGSVQLKYQGDKPSDALTSIESGSAKIEIPVKDLVVDSPDAAQGITEIFTKAQLWNAKTDKLEPGNAETVRENMLADSQLNASRFAKIEGSGKFESCQKIADSQLQCLMQLTVTVRDKAVIKSLPVTISGSGKDLNAEFTAKLKFSEFGIKAYTAMLGAIAVKDEFVLAGRLIATK